MGRFYIRLIAALVAILILHPTPALAEDARASVMMVLGFPFLVIGTLVLGIVEGIILDRWFQISHGLSILLLMIANYISVIAVIHTLGLGGGKPLLSVPSSVTLENGIWWLIAMVLVAFLIALVLGYFFFLWLLHRQLHPLRQALKATLIIHGVSYLLWFGLCYYLASPMTLLTHLKLVDAAEIQPAEDYDLYWISPEGNQVIRGNLLGTEQEIVKTIKKPGFLVACPAVSGNYLHLLLYDEFIVEELVAVAVIEPPKETGLITRDPCESSQFGNAVRLNRDSTWTYRTLAWSAGGVRGWSSKEKQFVRFAIETPFSYWQVRHLSHLEGDRLVFQLSEDQIYLLDPHERKIALVARGTSPLVVIPK